MRPEFDRFGIPGENIRAAEEAVKRLPLHELHSYVPTRKEVATLAANEITEMLTGWMCRSPIEIVPSRSQIIEVKTVLLNRPDVPELSGLVMMCERYIHNNL
ncbi:hypothetical protein [Collimonas humicola]|uniref:hypothetical protein n=1 Tax=Collimonas humicola TaxID=2825886 RepID=UPI001B8B44F9|nr:hypothetical protein [Collimonas humicola]